jgi:hypothetical protein
MSKPPAARILQITIGLGIVGSVVGGVLGAVLVAALSMRMPGFHASDLLGIGFTFGARMGAVLAPIAAWTLMRDVPIWRAIAETAAGTLVGAAIGLVFQPLYVAWLSPPLLGIGGFALAAIRLRLLSRRRTRIPASMD